MADPVHLVGHGDRASHSRLDRPRTQAGVHFSVSFLLARLLRTQRQVLGRHLGRGERVRWPGASPCMPGHCALAAGRLRFASGEPIGRRGAWMRRWRPTEFARLVTRS